MVIKIKPIQYNTTTHLLIINRDGVIDFITGLYYMVIDCYKEEKLIYRFIADPKMYTNLPPEVEQNMDKVVVKNLDNSISGIYEITNN